MAQFDVHHNPGLAARHHALCGAGAKWQIRILPGPSGGAPGAAQRAAGELPTVGSRLNPVVSVQGLELVLHPLDMGSVAVDQLGSCVGSLARKIRAVQGMRRRVVPSDRFDASN
jgi:hypothetical protein